MIGRRVEYQTGFGCSGTGVIIKHFDLTGVFVVQDEDDGSLWRGWEDQLTFLDEVPA